MKRIVVALALLGAGPAPVSQQSVFGIPVGQALTLPPCASMEGAPNIISPIQHVTCQETSTSQTGTTWDTARVHFAFESLPSIVKDGEMEVMLINGKTVGFQFQTEGIESQDIALSQLTAKYGKPATLERNKVSNLNGASFDSVTALWSSKGLVVTLLGTLSRLDAGLVTIDTPAASAMRKAALKRAVDAHTAL